MAPGSSKGKQSSNPRPDVRNPGDGQTPANNPNQDSQSQNVVPAQSTSTAHEGDDSSSSAPPSPSKFDIYVANARASGRGIYKPDPNAVRLAHTTVGQFMLAPPGAPYAPATAVTPKPPGDDNHLFNPTDEEFKICYEKEDEIVKLLAKNKDWRTIGTAIGVPFKKVASMWRWILVQNHPELEVKGRIASEAVGLQQRKIESAAKKPL